MQSSVRYDLGFGVPGEIKYDGPLRANSGVLNSADAAYNIVGSTFFTQPVAGGAVVAGGTIGNSYKAFGILAKPKSYASLGTSSGTLAPTVVLPNNINAEFVEMGFIVITLAAACNIGDLLLYNTTSGALSTTRPITTANVTIASGGVATVNTVTTGSIGVGTVFKDSSGNIVATVTELGTGTGGTGTYQTDNTDGASAADYTADTVPASGYAFVPGGVIDRVHNTAAGLAVAKLTN